MFGLMRIKKHQKQIDEINKLLKREKLRSLYWNYKYMNPDSNPIILGDKESIEYITQNNVDKREVI